MVAPMCSATALTEIPLIFRGLEEVFTCGMMVWTRRSTATGGPSVEGIDIRIARIRSGLKLYELAQRAGIREPELSMIETGRRQPSPEKAARIAEALDTAGSPADQVPA
jgi:DNA-binding XRE family transcriptional regulator